MLLEFDGLEETLEVSDTETFVVFPLDDFEEESGSVLNGFGEDLEEVTFVIIVDEDFVFLNSVDVFGDFDVHVWEVFPEDVIVGVWNSQEFDSSLSHVFNGVDDFVGVHGDVLDSSVMVVVNVFLNLGFFLSSSWLIDRHFDILIIVGYDNGPQG